MLPEPIDARSGHILWVDEAMQVHYERAGLVRRHLKKTALQAANDALLAIRANRLDDADRCANRSLSAQESCFEAWVVKAAVQRLRGREDKVHILRDAGTSHCHPDTFDIFLEALAGKTSGDHGPAAEKAAS